MDSLIRLLTEYRGADTIVIIILFLVSLKWIVETVINVKNTISNFLQKNHEELKEEEDKEEETDTRLDNIEQDSAKMQEYLAELHTMLEKVVDEMKQFSEESRRISTANSRSTIYRVCSEAIARGYMKQIEFEVIDELGDIYIKLGGNHTAKDLLLPTTLALPVQGVDGNMYKATPQNGELIKMIKERNNDREIQEVVNS